MAPVSPQHILSTETRVTYGVTPRGLAEQVLEQDCWQLAGDEFLLREGANHYFHYRKGCGITIERGAGADHSVEAIWLSGSVYSAVACINGFMPIHVSAVCHGGAVYAFTGPSGAGKSTLVAALASAQMPLFCDDTLVLDLSDPDRVMCMPGHKRLKLTPEGFEMTGAERQERVGLDIDKFYARPAEIYEGEPLPLGRLVFLEQKDGAPMIAGIRGAERLTRLQDDHYTAFHFAAARQFDPAEYFRHLSRLARQIEMASFVRPMDKAQFEAGIDMMRAYILGSTSERAAER